MKSPANYFIMVLPFFCQTLFAQKVELIKSIQNAKTAGITEYYSAVSGKGFIYIRELKGSIYSVTFFDYDFNQSWNKEAHISSIKRMKLFTTDSRENELSILMSATRLVMEIENHMLRDSVSHPLFSSNGYKFPSELKDQITPVINKYIKPYLQ